MVRICVFLSAALFSNILQAQTTLSFCTSVEKEGYCAFENNQFITSPDSNTGRIYMLLRNSEGIGEQHITYKISSLDEDGRETVLPSIEQSMDATWIYAWQIGFFKSPGKYRISVLTDAGNQICSKSFELYSKR